MISEPEISPELPDQCKMLPERLGECGKDSPLNFPDEHFAMENELVLYNRTFMADAGGPTAWRGFEKPGPFKKLFYNHRSVNAAIVTCGGLCPGLNDVIRSITYCCLDAYRIKNVYGFRYGYSGLTSAGSAGAVSLTQEMVNNIHEQGGTILGTSRGAQSIEDIVDTLVKFNISMLFTIGGEGTHHGAMKIAGEIKRRNLKIAVIGIPKTIDNDIAYIHKTFGFDTAVEEARKVINSANAEAKGAFNGIGLVKLMGRYAGFIAAHASLASGNVNICLIPEEPFDLKGLCRRIKDRFSRRDHVVIVVAEGVGQNLLNRQEARRYDESGNLKLKDIGPFLKQKIGEYLAREKVPHTIKYIDPSYMIRSTPANAIDSSFCLQLGNYATHAAMAGRTNCMIGFWNQHFCLVPIELALSRRKSVDINGPIWRFVREITV